MNDGISGPAPPDEWRIPDRYRSLFLHTMNSDLAQLECALASQDWRLAAQTLHRMNGALAMLGMTTLSARVGAAEDKLARGARDAAAFQDASRLLLELRDLVCRV